MDLTTRARRAAVLAVCLFVCVTARAAPDEIQVYTEELNDPGEVGLELHVNYVIEGARVPAYPGEKPSHHLLQMTPEFSYGINRTLEGGLYLPVAVAPDGNVYGNGVRVRLKYIAPRGEGASVFWGLNVEFGYFARRVSESHLGIELRPIVGYRDADWLVSFNPIIDTDLSSNVSRAPNFEPALKLARRLTKGVHAGVKYYGEFGPIERMPADQRAHFLYAALDFEKNGYDINFGIGRGFENAADKWVAKAIFAIPFK